MAVFMFDTIQELSGILTWCVWELEGGGEPLPATWCLPPADWYYWDCGCVKHCRQFINFWKKYDGRVDHSVMWINTGKTFVLQICEPQKPCNYHNGWEQSKKWKHLQSPVLSCNMKYHLSQWTPILHSMITTLKTGPSPEFLLRSTFSKFCYVCHHPCFLWMLITSIKSVQVFTKCHITSFTSDKIMTLY